MVEICEWAGSIHPHLRVLFNVIIVVSIIVSVIIIIIYCEGYRG